MRMAGSILQSGGLELDCSVATDFAQCKTQPRSNVLDGGYGASSRKRGNDVPGDGSKRSRFSQGEPEPAEEEMVRVRWKPRVTRRHAQVALIIENLFE